MLHLVHSQNTLELTYTAIDNADYVQLDSIKVMNRTQGGDTVLYYPDTVLVLDYAVGIGEVNKENSGLHVFQNYPNPVKDHSTVTIQIPSSGKVKITVADLMGRQILKSEYELEKGYHSFSFAPGAEELFFFTAQWKNDSRSIKILNALSNSNRIVSLKYIGSNDFKNELKVSAAIQSFSFNMGDTLLYIGYYDTSQSGMLDSPEVSDTYGNCCSY